MATRVYIDVSDPDDRRRVQRGAVQAGWTEVSRIQDADFVLRDGPAQRGAVGPRDAAQSVAAHDDDSSFALTQEALTARELQVLKLLAEGVGNREIAERLSVSEHTVKFHLSAIFGKLGASTRTDAVRRALRAGLIDL